MKLFYTIFLIFLFNINLLGQNQEELNKINLAIVLPEDDEVDAKSVERLNYKITQVLTENNIMSGLNNSFIIYPIINITNKLITETGLYNLITYEIQLDFHIKNLESNTVFSTFTKEITGTGKTEKEAIGNAIGKLNPKDENFKKFITKGKENIINYYSAQCKQIIQKADKIALMGDYEQALALLISIPSEVECYQQAIQNATVIYSKYKSKECNAQILEAKSYFAQGDKYTAAEVLASINPESSCKAESHQLLKQIENKLNEEEKREWNFKVKQHTDNVQLMNARINAIKEISKAYYKKNPITYNYIIK